MASEVARGEIWMYRFASPDRRRPVLRLTRPVLLRVLETATVAAVTPIVRGSPTEVILGVEEGRKAVCCVNLVNVFTVRQSDLRKYVGMVSSEKMRAVCRALAIACSCEDACAQPRLAEARPS